jgi:hypothetical protein
LPVVIVIVIIFIPLAFPIEPTGQHPNLILFLYKSLKFGELFKQLAFLKRIKRRDLAQLGVQEGLENCIGVLKLCHMANQGRLLCRGLDIVRVDKSFVLLLFQVVNVFLECVISGRRDLQIQLRQALAPLHHGHARNVFVQPFHLSIEFERGTERKI